MFELRDAAGVSHKISSVSVTLNRELFQPGEIGTLHVSLTGEADLGSGTGQSITSHSP